MTALDAASGLHVAVLGNLASPAEASSVDESGSMCTLAQHAAAAAADTSIQVSDPAVIQQVYLVPHAYC